MKQFNLKTVNLKKPDGTDTTLEYRALILQIMRNPIDIQHGADIEEIRKSIRVIDAVEAADGVCKLEDTDYAFMVKKIRGARFMSASQAIVDFVDEVCGEAV